MNFKQYCSVRVSLYVLDFWQQEDESYIVVEITYQV